MRLIPNSYLLTLIMWCIRSLFYPLNHILLCYLQNLFLLTVFVSCCFLPPIHNSILYLTFVGELEWSLK